jgi:hypothetical protein
MTIDLDGFEQMEFPQHRDIVYIFHYVRGEGSEPIPFYVGESSRHVGRFGDYVAANFSASTDFKVGEAVKYLREKGVRVVVTFKESPDRKGEERRLLQHLRSTFRLLNDLKGYRYGSADADGERLKIRQFIDLLLETPCPIERAAEVPKKLAVEGVGTIGDRPSCRASRDADLTVPERVKLICQELGAGGDVIKRQDILRIAKQRGLNETSVLPADYCDNTETGKWSSHSFLHSVGPGRYILR